MSELSASELAEVLQEYLVAAINRWNANNELKRPLAKMPWRDLDPLSRALYVERCADFLKEYIVIKKEAPDVQQCPPP